MIYSASTREAIRVGKNRVKLQVYVSENHASIRLKVNAKSNEEAIHIDIIKKIVLFEIDTRITVAEVKREVPVDPVGNRCLLVNHQVR